MNDDPVVRLKNVDLDGRVDVTPLSKALELWWHDDHFGIDCGGDGEHSESCVEDAFSDGWRAGEKNGQSRYDRLRVIAYSAAYKLQTRADLNLGSKYLLELAALDAECHP